MLFEKRKRIFLIGFGKFRFRFPAHVTRSFDFGRSDLAAQL